MKSHLYLLNAIALCALSSSALADATLRLAAAERDAQLNSIEPNLKAEMRKLWQDHIVCMRSFIVSAIPDRPDSQDAANRLLQNQKAITEAWSQYYGEPTAKKMGVLLRDHILISADVVKAANLNDKDRWSELQRKWEANGRNMAAFLASTNPHWNQADLAAMIQTQIDLLGAQVSARVRQDGPADGRAYEEAHTNIMKFADVMSDGIARQFPDRFERAAN